MISKSDRIGLWFCELCGVFKNGLLYMLDVMMHSSSKCKAAVESVISRWVAVVAMDLYYIDSAVRNLLRRTGRNVTASVTPDRFKAEVRNAHSGIAARKPGDFCALYNEVFVYHCDAENGIGKKYNYSIGFLRSTERAKLLEHAGRTQNPGVRALQEHARMLQSFQSRTER